MLNRLMRVVILLFWLELGLVLILVPWLELWETNYFLYQYPLLGMFVKNPFLRGAVSGLGFMNVLLSIGAFRRSSTRAASIVPTRT
jgi:hypothetical protein